MYERRVVAFVDMLGISDRLLALGSEGFARTIYAVTSALTSKRPGTFFVLPHVRTGREIEIAFDKPIGAGDRITTVSDAIVMSFPAEERENQFARGSSTLPILSCLQAVFWLQRGLLSLGVRTRGGICRGSIFHNSNFVFGEAMVRAYRLESRVAVFPRVVIDEEIVESLLSEPIPEGIAVFRNRIAHMVRLDADGRYFVDYLGYDPIQGDFYLSGKLADIFLETANDLKSATDGRLVAKLEWLKLYIGRSIEELSDKQARLRVNSGTKFGGAFPRTRENLMSFVAQAKAESRTSIPGGDEITDGGKSKR
jgi:hypothetical protein